MNFESIIYAIPYFVIGSCLLIIGRLAQRSYETLRYYYKLDTISSLQYGTPIGLTGKVKVEDTVLKSLEEVPCIFYQRTWFQKTNKFRRDTDPKAWKYLKSESDSIDFFLSDETGKVYVKALPKSFNGLVLEHNVATLEKKPKDKNKQLPDQAVKETSSIKEGVKIVEQIIPLGAKITIYGSIGMVDEKPTFIQSLETPVILTNNHKTQYKDQMIKAYWLIYGAGIAVIIFALENAITSPY
jgi:hypothetical protein